MSEITLEPIIESIAVKPEGSGPPKYQRLYNAFSKCIRSGLFKPGERVPSETELARRLPVSLGTVQQGLAELAAKGLITRHRKTGTFIADGRSQVDQVFAYRYKDPETGRFMLPFVRALAVEVDESPGPWNEAFGSKHCVRVDRLVWVAQDPPAYSSVFFAYEHGKSILDQPVNKLHGSSIHQIIIKLNNLPLLRMEHSISCQTLTYEACEYLMVPVGTMGIIWDIMDYSFDDYPLMFQRFQLPPGHRPVELRENIKRH